VIFDQTAPFWSKLLIVLAGISALMLVRAIHATVAAPALTTENLIPLIFSVLLASIIVLLQNPLAIVLHNTPGTPRRLSWPSVASAMTLGIAIFFFQVIV
jgi:hypothetical protein